MPPVQWNDGLALAARRHCQDKRAKGHRGSDGSGFTDRMKPFGEFKKNAGELISTKRTIPDEIIQ